jgi:hypothetical protein
MQSDDPDDREPVQAMSVDEIEQLFRLLGKLRSHYVPLTNAEHSGWAIIVEVQRLCELELRHEHGDVAWEAFAERVYG